MDGILRFDGDGRRVERKLRQTTPLDEASMRVWPAMWERTEVPPPEAVVLSLESYGQEALEQKFHVDAETGIF